MKLWTVLPTSQHDVAPTLCLRARTVHTIFTTPRIAMAPIRRSLRARYAPFRYTDNGTRSAPTDPRSKTIRKVHDAMHQYLLRDTADPMWEPMPVCLGVPGGTGCTCQTHDM